MADLKEMNFEEEVAEEVMRQFLPTGWPEPVAFNDGSWSQSGRWRLVFEAFNLAIEELYFWALDNLRLENEFPMFDKITDLFAATEQSAFFGVAQQRLGLQQDKVSQFLATIGKMVKELFQLVREIRILDERLEYYLTSYQGDLASEITLKGYWIDLVEGGAKNPASVYGMARELQFTTLPDLFFAAPPMEAEKVVDYVESLKFNKKVKEVLMRKLKSYLVWKGHTFKELKSRRLFTLKYLRQHYEIIRMYMAWVKPYLKNIRRMQLDMNKIDLPDMISAFEGSMIEIEFLAKKPMEKGGVYAVMDFHFLYRSRPELKFQQEGYQRGPLHVGKVQMTIRSYVWTAEEIEKYKKYRAQEDFDLIGMIDSSVEAAYTALGEELENYLAEAGETDLQEFEKMKEQEKAMEKEMKSPLAPFKAVAKGFGVLGKSLAKEKKAPATCPQCHRKVKPEKPYCAYCLHQFRKITRKEALEQENAKKEAKKYLQSHMYNFVKRFKAAHGFIY
ncbi:hypothetical protein HYS48_02010 [Candidatus Woesearchaeota archaeon]|nr:hypothetical protein [Candidatus Woesearchaeota archaeon]